METSAMQHNMNSFLQGSEICGDVSSHRITLLCEA
jgi:hypothetical protein